jgi:hypothetical protein
VVPQNGTDLQQAFRAVAGMTELPDNILLITDGLPTLGDDDGRTSELVTEKERYVTENERLDRFADAIDELPRNIPVNTILLPLDGDRMAASAYWALAQRSKGSFLAPSKDWP